MSTSLESPTVRSPLVTGPLTILAAGIALVVGTIGLGKFSLLDSVKKVDEALFELSLDVLQAVPGLTTVSEFVTRIGAIPVNYGMAIGAALLLALATRRLTTPFLIVLTLTATHVLQKVTDSVVEGIAPVDDRIIGAAGPYFSGGVARVIVLVGMFVTVARMERDEPRGQRQDRSRLQRDPQVWRLAVLVGAIEALTRLALGRHWPIDLLASFPIGLTIVWLFRRTLELTATGASFGAHGE